MTDNPTSPFVPGARVAIDDRWGNCREAFVEKVYKNGNFTLRGDNWRQQWRPRRSGHEWSATPTGADPWTRTKLRIWDAMVDAEISAKIALAKRKTRREAILDAIRRLPDDRLTDAMLDAIEAALASVGEKEPVT